MRSKIDSLFTLIEELAAHDGLVARYLKNGVASQVVRGFSKSILDYMKNRNETIFIK